MAKGHYAIGFCEIPSHNNDNIADVVHSDYMNILLTVIT